MATKKQVQNTERNDNSKVNPITRFVTYVEESKAELYKVSWPTLKETRKATFVVLGFIAVMSILLGLVDLGLSSLTQFILS